MIFISRLSVSTIADSWTSRRALISDSSSASFRAKPRLSDNAARIRMNARTTNTLICTERNLNISESVHRAQLAHRRHGVIVFAFGTNPLRPYLAEDNRRVRPV